MGGGRRAVLVSGGFGGKREERSFPFLFPLKEKKGKKVLIHFYAGESRHPSMDATKQQREKNKKSKRSFSKRERKRARDATQLSLRARIESNLPSMRRMEWLV